jgi:hypothetical protein
MVPAFFKIDVTVFFGGIVTSQSLFCAAPGAASGKQAADRAVPDLTRAAADGGRYRAAVTMISTLYWGAASPASTVARAGVFPADTQPSHTAFISAKFFISVR